MISCKKQLCALVLVSTCAFSFAHASETLNLKLHKHRFNAHHARMEAAGTSSALSAEFLAVREGLNNGTCHFDLETAQHALREVYRDEELEAQSARALEALSRPLVALAPEVEETENAVTQ